MNGNSRPLLLLSLLSLWLILPILLIYGWGYAQLTGPWTSVSKSLQGVTAGVSGYTITETISEATGGSGQVTGFIIDLSAGGLHTMDFSAVTYPNNAGNVGVSIYFVNYVTEYPMQHFLWWREPKGGTPYPIFCAPDHTYYNSCVTPEFVSGATPVACGEMDGMDGGAIYVIEFWTGIESGHSLYVVSGTTINT